MTGGRSEHDEISIRTRYGPAEENQVSFSVDVDNLNLGDRGPHMPHVPGLSCSRENVLRALSSVGAGMPAVLAVSVAVRESGESVSLDHASKALALVQS